MNNRLAGETSPYLRQHAGNPVHWQPWDPQALQSARDQGRPILLSIGYSACHWCHVMAHESFEDDEVADVMNRLFVNIKVDREERPDLDQIYQTAHQMLTGRAGGWPLTLFLTPDGVPFFGGTYFPKEPRYNLPGFPDLCQRVAQAFATRRDDIAGQNQELLRALGNTVAQGGAQLADANVLARLRNHLLSVLDRNNGGFGGAPKFPHPTDLAFLLRQAMVAADEEAREAVLLSLTRMAEGGLQDQLGGGFCRYSVDERWEIPHFEKMLYDNGQLLGLYADGFILSGNPYFRQVAAATADWALNEMQSSSGAFYAALDADSEGEEGRFYVWDRKAVRALLSAEEWAVAAPHWGLDSTPNFEGHWHLKVDRPLAEADRPLLAAARARLLAARGSRVRPGLDDKCLTSWNALMISGLLRADRVFRQPTWGAAARRALDFIRNTLWTPPGNGEPGRLLAAPATGERRLAGYLDDYAFLLAALLEALQTELSNGDLAWVQAVADALIVRFEDPAGGGFFFTAHDHETLILRPKPAHDNAMPAGNGVAALALQRLGHLLGEPRYLEAAERVLKAFSATLQGSPGGCATLALALAEHLTPPTLVMLTGPAAERQVWADALAGSLRPDTLLFSLPSGQGLPAALAKPEGDQVNAWVCQGVTCLPPVDSLDQLRSLLGKA